MVLIVEGHKAEEDALPADALRTLALLQAELPLKKAAALAAEIHGVKKNALYKYALEQQGSKPLRILPGDGCALPGLRLVNRHRLKHQRFQRFEGNHHRVLYSAGIVALLP